jgi:aryl-alcohol dehydrogenase-like predicted oxidoreductase
MTQTDPSTALGRSPAGGRLGTVRTRFAPDATSEIGFGCALLMGSVPRDRSLRLLATAHDHGVRHFDTARLYGHGWSEDVLGEFLRGRRDRVTVATKFGLEPPSMPGPVARLRSMARAAVDAISPRLRAAAGRGARRLVRRGAFGVADARRALERSLRLLRIDRIDLWLLHDCTLEDLSDGALEDFLDAERRRGTIVAFGVATSAGETARILAARPGLAGIVQVADDPFAPVSTALRAAAAGRPVEVVQHSVLRPMLEGLARLDGDTVARAALASAGLDPADRTRFAALALAAARRINPRGVTLVSSTRPDHLAALLRAAADPPDAATVETFVTLVRPLIRAGAETVR